MDAGTLDLLSGAIDRARVDLASGKTDYSEFLKQLKRYCTEEGQSLYPKIEGDDFLLKGLMEKDTLIEGIMERGDVVSISAPSKARKSWFLLHLVSSLASGLPWYGKPILKPAKCLYVDFELKPNSFHRRIRSVWDLGMPKMPIETYKRLTVWNLRGFDIKLEKIMSDVHNAIISNGYEVVIFDPLYKLYNSSEKASIDENRASDMVYLISKFNELSRCNGSTTIIWSSHYTKADRSSLQHIDRMAGSGVQAREPDLIMSLTPLEAQEEGEVGFVCNDYRLEITARDYPPIAPIDLTWEYPIYKRNGLLGDRKLKGSAGAPKKCTYSEVVAVWLELSATKGPAIEISIICDYMGISLRTLQRAIYGAIKDKRNEYSFEFKDKCLCGKAPYKNSTAVPNIPLDPL